ncbi:MAG TPA: hypothetical protein VN680_05515 [Burkholderiaceae bacterium]|jgi:hypothetical protein|nr:hypothetical protein [Burkholderiaceae bacterium]
MTTSPDLESVIATVESRLEALSEALRSRDTQALELSAAALHRSLALALDECSAAARRGPLPTALRQRLVRAGGQVAAQRESLARATASLDRAIDALIPRAAHGYAHSGLARATSAGVVAA